MAQENLISVSFTPEEIQEAIGHLNSIRTSLDDKCISLTPDERREFGRIGNKTETGQKK